ncbi:MAG TPA: tRNA (adenosine(37)-N6)-threonylcarbamoyltransferase complex ATPase subunit type 1 TsaE [Pyrinomonadaceae bacterium]|nr:tRNA (adenosine(37)-N6)-threonylcarbamoyltransferase complex ATPase subunit type 1 TsaE [Pyrinomonadaceae bacterium]
MNTFSVICKGREETARVAGLLAPRLRPGDSILLKGALAGGKTAFVQELVAALGSTAEVTSPTFTIAQFYPLPAGTFLHIDAYRLSSVAEFRDLALEEYIAESITAVEWGDIVEEDFPNALTIDFEFIENQDNWRHLTFSAAAERWQPVLASLRTQLQI